jgi:hypothetical protein
LAGLRAGADFALLAPILPLRGKVGSARQDWRIERSGGIFLRFPLKEGNYPIRAQPPDRNFEIEEGEIMIRDRERQNTKSIQGEVLEGQSQNLRQSVVKSMAYKNLDRKRVGKIRQSVLRSST